MSAAPNAPTTADWLLVSLLGILWGGSFMAIAVAVRELPPLTVAAGRIGLGAVLLLLYLRLSRRFDAAAWRDPVHWRFALGMGLLSNAIPFTLLAWAEQYVTSSFAGLTMAFMPLLVLVIAHYVIPGEPLTGRRLVGFSIGLIGVVVLIDPFGVAVLRDHGQGYLPELACLGSVLCYALGSILTRNAPKRQPLNLATQSLLMGAMIMVPLAGLIDGLPGPVSWPALGSLLYLAILPTALANALLVMVIQRAGAGFFSLVNYQVPLWATVFGVAFLSESLGVNFLIALAMILLGLAVGQGFGRRRAR